MRRVETSGARTILKVAPVAEAPPGLLELSTSFLILDSGLPDETVLRTAATISESRLPVNTATV